MSFYQVTTDRQAEKFLSKLRDATLLRRILEAIDGLGKNPRPPGCKKMVGSIDRYRMRVGDYRIIYRVDDGLITVLVLAIGHRREVYE